MPAPIPDDVRAAILADIKANGGERSCRGIARDHGVSDATVRKIAKDAGITDAFSRAQTKKATEASRVDHAARRAVLAEQWLSLAEDAVAQTRAQLADAKAKDAATIAAIAVDKHRALDQYDSDTQGLAVVDAWLRAITGE